MRQSYHRLDGGQPLRDAMKADGWRLQALAARTREVDPERKGVSYQLIAFLRTPRRWGRGSTSQRTAELIAQALELPVGALFAIPENST